MPTIGITGGIATGKSTFRARLLERFNAVFFDTDACAADLLANDPAIRSKVIDEFSAAAYLSEAEPNREFLRNVVFPEPERRRALEAILHPPVRAAWTRAASEATRPFVLEIPLLFETQSEALFDLIITVACPPATQLRRLDEKRGVAADLGRKILASQCELGVKISGAHHVVWNDGSPELLDAQANLLASLLISQYD
ncbi:MAG: dephospho-CoA kinase [Chthoniobacterales bacterium]